MNRKKRILLITTGGTIASVMTEEGLAPTTNGESLGSRLISLLDSYKITVESIFNLDSSNIQPEEWKLIGNNIAQEYKKYDGIVLTHGTDTLAYTASILSFMLRNIPIPVVLTGSQLPIFAPLTDAVDNLRYAFAMAASGHPGVFVAFNRKIILGVRAVKVRTFGFDAFESVNLPCVANSDSTGLIFNHSVLPKINGEFCFESNLCKDVFLIKLTPGFNPEIFEMLLKMNYKGIVVEAFGAGGLHFLRRDLVAKLQKVVEKGISVVVCSQCLYERSDFSIYQTGVKALETGVIEAHDMTTEAAVTKLMWALGKTQDQNMVREIFRTNYVGEITIK